MMGTFDTFDSEFSRIKEETKSREEAGVMDREDAALNLARAAKALGHEAARLVDTPWEDGDEALFKEVEEALAAWRRAVAWRE